MTTGFGCATPTNEPDAASIQLTSGSITLREELRLGLSDPLFAGLFDAKQSTDGSIYVLDGKTAVVYSFTEDGTYRGILGEKGEGPGEYVWPATLMVASDSIMIVDARYDKVLVLAPDGTLQSRTNKVESDTPSRMTFLGRFDDRYLVVETPYPIAGELRERVVNFVDGRGQLSQKIWRAPKQDLMILKHKDNTYWLPAPFKRDVFCASVAERLYCGWNGNTELHRFDQLGNRDGSISIPIEPILVSAEEREAITEATPQLYKDLLDFPEFKPLYTGLVADDHGKLWVRLSPNVDTETSDYLVVDPEASTATRAVLPIAGDITQVIGDRAYAKALTSDGEPVVVRYAVVSSGD